MTNATSTRVYNFAVGNPDPVSFPGVELAEAAHRIIPTLGDGLVTYPGSYGWTPLREIAAARFAKNNGVDLPLENIALTSGSMQAIGLCCQNYIMPGAGDTIVAEEYSYSGTLRAFRQFGAKVASVPVDDDGMNMDALGQTLDGLASQGIRPKFIYTIATNQNPTGTMMTEERRHRLVALARKHNVLILDDDCYADLLFEGAAPPSLYALDPDNTVYIGSFSKVLGPGARLGYFATRKDRLDEILAWKIDGGNSVLAAATAAEYFNTNLWPHIEEINGIVKGKLDAVEDALDANKDAFPYHSHPKGGLFIWVKLPDDTDVNRLLSIADSRNVKYGTGKSFHSQNEDIKYLRIAYGYASLDDIREGVPLLAECVREARGIAVAPSVG